LVTPEEQPPFVVRVLRCHPQHPFAGDEHQAAVVVLDALPSPTRVLYAVENLERCARGDTREFAVRTEAGRVELAPGQHPGVELGAEAELADLVVVLEGKRLPALLYLAGQVDVLLPDEFRGGADERAAGSPPESHLGRYFGSGGAGFGRLR